MVVLLLILLLLLMGGFGCNLSIDGWCCDEVAVAVAVSASLVVVANAVISAATLALARGAANSMTSSSVLAAEDG